MSASWSRSSELSLSPASWLPTVGKNGHPVEGVAIGLVEARVPLVVLVARAGGVLVAEVDVVAGGEHQPDVARVDGPLERTGDEQLADAVETPVDDPDPEVAEHGERDRGAVVVDRRERAEAVVVAAARRDQRGLLDAPVVQLARGPRPAVDEHAVAILGVRLEARRPRRGCARRSPRARRRGRPARPRRWRARTAPSRRRSSRCEGSERPPSAPRRRRSATRRTASPRAGSRSRPTRSAPCRDRDPRGAGTPRSAPRSPA